MKNFGLISLSIVLLIFTGCGKIEDLIKIKVEDTSTLIIPSNTIINLPIDILTPETETNLDEELANNNSRKDKIKTIRLQELTVTITNPSGESFNFLNSIKLYIRADGFAEREIAYLDQIPNDAGSELVLNVYDDDLSDYLKQDKYSLRANVKTDELITQQMEIEIYTRFEVTADIF